MKTVAEQLVQLNQIKEDIKDALLYQGVSVANDDGLATFAQKVRSISASTINFTLTKGSSSYNKSAVTGCTFRTYISSSRNSNTPPLSIVTFGGQDLVMLTLDNMQYQVLNVTADTVIANGTTYTVDTTPFSPTISFSIYGKDTYQADEGMLWGAWVDSAYNTGGYEKMQDIYNGLWYVVKIASPLYDTVTTLEIHPDEAIIADRVYRISNRIIED